MAQSFEDTIAQSLAELKLLDEGRNELVNAVIDAAGGADMPDEAGVMSLRKRRDMLSGEQKKNHAQLAEMVGQIAAIIEAERSAFDQKEVPLPVDTLIGYFSKSRMRRRIDERFSRSGSAERLRLALGRADRLAGLLDGERRAALAQRSAVEAAFAIWRNDTGKTEPITQRASPRLPAEIMAIFSAIADIPGDAVRDHTILLQKLTFDSEHLLDLYGVLSQILPEMKSQRLSPEAYPYFTEPVRRLRDGVSPGARLSRIRHAADLAFAERFSPA